ncbi:hypothetical protein Zm00014a_027364 [Zea mays]|uniref:Uncharacterized protein n=1 Tax=Zea mays TaxID=4577 RepID=A0A3L6FS54_MAIZE|nr:hypothetical protein Zm00014a_027364 [Zea mays]
MRCKMHMYEYDEIYHRQSQNKL